MHRLEEAGIVREKMDYEDAVKILFSGKPDENGEASVTPVVTTTIWVDNLKGKYPKTNVTAEVFTNRGRLGLYAITSALPTNQTGPAPITINTGRNRVVKVIYRWGYSFSQEEAAYTRKATDGQYIQEITLGWGNRTAARSDEPAIFVTEVTMAEAELESS